MSIAVLFILIILISSSVLIICGAVTTAVCSFKTGGALYTRTPQKTVEAILDVLELADNMIVYDLGCGDGRFLFEAEKRAKISGMGFEINPLPFFLAVITRFFRRSNVQFRFSNFWDNSVSDANVIFCYLFPDVLVKLKEKLETELIQETIVISCNFPIENWTAEKYLAADGTTFLSPVYLYKFFPKQSI